MNLYETVKTSVTPREAAERLGIHISRGSMARCPFHPDKTPSMKLYEDHFYCFGCGASGDVIDLTGKVNGFSPYEAAKWLTNTLHIEQGRTTPINRQNKSAIHQERERENRCFSVLMDYLRLLERWKIELGPASPSDEMDQRFVEACKMLAQIEYYADVLVAGDAEERTELVDELTKSGMIHEITQRLHRKEGMTYVENRYTA